MAKRASTRRIPRLSGGLNERKIYRGNARASLLVLTPASFRQRNVFTIPEDVVRLRRGRPRVSDAQKIAKAHARDQRYRQRMRQLIEIGRRTKKLESEKAES